MRLTRRYASGIRLNMPEMCGNDAKAAAARNRVLDEVAQTVSSVVRPHGVTLTWKAACATHHGQSAKNGFWLLELSVRVRWQ